MPFQISLWCCQIPHGICVLKQCCADDEQVTDSTGPESWHFLAKGEEDGKLHT